MKTTQALKSRFSRALEAPGRLHFAAHSHHPWPDVSFEAQQRAWLEAAAELDFKWEHIFGDVIPAAQGHVARILGLSDPSTVVFGPNTHDFVKRVFSCVERKPVSVLTTDGEFHSFDRQSRRWDEAGLAVVERIPLEPFATFEDRFLERAESGEHDVIYVSQVFYGSGFVFGRFAELAERAPEDAIVVIDGYHGFFALPTDLSGVEGRFFYTAGGYKYAMSGEGVCFLHCPPGYGDRPVDTGWYAGFSELVLGTGAQVAYAR
ncbi:MAG TPA: class V aminotransferase, partial [bacterium]|nr:class V aminotransferase [bacterium]